MQRPRYALLCSAGAKRFQGTVGFSVGPIRLKQRQALQRMRQCTIRGVCRRPVCRPCSTAGKCVVDAWISAGNTYAPSAPVPVVALGVSCTAAEEEYWTDCSAAAACVGSERLIASTCDGCALLGAAPRLSKAEQMGFPVALALPSLPVWSYVPAAIPRVSRSGRKPLRSPQCHSMQCLQWSTKP